MTGREILNPGDAIWDDGEWISWAWIETQVGLEDDEQDGIEQEAQCEVAAELEEELPEPSAELLFRIVGARNHYENTLDEISPEWGAIGEAYLAECFGVTLCRRHTEGHDARLGDDLIEIKTITPHKRRAFVTVKRAGNFNVLAVVRITRDGVVDVRFVRRNQLPEGQGGKRIAITWQRLCRVGKRRPY